MPPLDGVTPVAKITPRDVGSEPGTMKHPSRRGMPYGSPSPGVSVSDPVHKSYQARTPISDEGTQAVTGFSLTSFAAQALKTARDSPLLGETPHFGGHTVDRL